MSYELQTYTLIDGWVNCCSVDGEPELFDSERDAVEALRDHIECMTDADMDFDFADYRIVKNEAS